MAPDANEANLLAEIDRTGVPPMPGASRRLARKRYPEGRPGETETMAPTVALRKRREVNVPDEDTSGLSPIATVGFLLVGREERQRAFALTGVLGRIFLPSNSS